MKAAALIEPGNIGLIDTAEPNCGADDVVLRMLGVGLCGTDMGVVRGERTAPHHPWVLGHEGVGEIVAVGDSVDNSHLGSRVALEPNYCCLRCRECKSGFTSGCPDRIAVGLGVPGVLSEYVAAPAEFVHPVADHVNVRDLVCAEPLTVARSAVRRSGITTDDRCLVVGAGSQGLFLCRWLVAAGITPFVQEPHAGRHELALSLGALPIERADGQVDHVFETSGVPSALGTALRHTVAGATVTLIGMGGEPLGLSERHVVNRQLSLVGSLIYDHPDDFADTIDALSGLAPHRVLGAEFGLADTAAAFEAVATTPGKVWVNIDGAA
ncbi:zinc-dependent alcohol dehydrogenase [Actinopolyspora sp. H202]|uniref:zinc-dependent alcohol dehydrogenase n=1 Tax=Actinopolyspora sp. H202 TaxID=1500456 RepID=UPI003EE81BE0